MSDAILDSFRHDAWATRTLISFCRSLNPEVLAASARGGYGSVLDTFQHLVVGELYYYSSLFTGSYSGWETKDEPRSLDELSSLATEAAATWDSLLKSAIDGDNSLTTRRPDGTAIEVRAGVLLAQVLHHGNVHREQVCASRFARL